MGIVRSAMCMSLDGIDGGYPGEGWAVHERLHGWKFQTVTFRRRLGLGDDGEDGVDSKVIDEELTLTPRARWPTSRAARRSSSTAEPTAPTSCRTTPRSVPRSSRS